MEFAPRLADSWDIGKDNTEFTFHLGRTPSGTTARHHRRRCRIHHVGLSATPRSSPTAKRQYFLKGLKKSQQATRGRGDRRNIEVIDDHTIKFITKNPIDPLALLEQLGNQVWIIPKHIAQEMWTGGVRHPAVRTRQSVPGGRSSSCATRPTSSASGAQRRLLRRQATPGQDNCLHRHPHHHGRPSSEKGEVDIAAAGGIGDIPLDDWERDCDDGDHRHQLPGQRLPVRSRQHAPRHGLGRQAARQALAYGISRQLIVDSLLKGEGVIAQGPIDAMTYYYNPEVGVSSPPTRKDPGKLRRSRLDPTTR